MAAPGREVDAVVHVLDRQVVDPDEHMVCNVDDLELAVPEAGGPPYVTAILAGPAALAPRYGGLLGRWVLAVQRRLHPSEQPGPARIDFGVVDELSSRVKISLRREELWVNAFEEWCRDNVIDKIPGARHANE
jgi:hypothetical protein